MRVFGIDVFAHWSLVLVPFVLLALIGKLIGPEMLSAPAALGWTALWTVIAVAVVFSHEFGHALVGRWLDEDTGAIVLTPLGPLSHDESAAHSPRTELVTSLAGPAVHGLWLLPAWGAWIAITRAGAGPAVQTMVLGFLFVNAALAALNFLPFFPLDGGRAVRALLAMRVDAHRAELWTAYLGYGGAVTMGLVGLALLLTGDAAYVSWALLLLGVGVTNLIAAQRLLFAVQFLSRPRVPPPSDWQTRGAPDFLDDRMLAEAGPPPRPARRAPTAREAPAPEPEPVESPEERRARLQERIDELLDRINEVGGMAGLSAEERRELAEASEMLRNETARR